MTGEPDAPRMADEDPNQDLSLAMPTTRGAVRLLTRAVRLRCPYCGGGPVLVHWFKVRNACGRCGKLLERGEGDYFIGSMLFNLVIAEFLFVIAFGALLLSTWPTPPWGFIEKGAPVAAVLAPAILFPFSKLVWLAMDLMFRPDRGKETE
jgi:uncharacterized protein (DUF983 family)